MVTARLVLSNVVLIDWVFLHVASTGAVGGVHAAKVLCEKVFAVEVIVVVAGWIVGVGGRCAEIAAPETKLDVLRADMALPLIL